MDHIQDLSAFQGVILSVDNLYSLAKLTSKGGNEDKVKYVIEKLSNFLKEKNYIDENGVVKEKYEEYQKLALYIVLNADLPALADMTDAEGLDAVVWTLPTLPAYLLCELFWGLHMQRILCEIVAFCEPRLALQVADAFSAHLRHAAPERRPGRVRLLAGALYRLVGRLRWRVAAEPALLAAALASFRLCLAGLAEPPGDELSGDARHRQLGRSLAATLLLVEECLAGFTADRPFRAEGFADAYLSTHRPGSLATENPDLAIGDSPDLSECLHGCNALLLDRCATQVMSVSVDAFCAWSEYEDDGGSVQRTVGELAHRVGLLLRGVPGAADHALVGMLEQISLRPVAPADVVEDTPPAAIVRRVAARDAHSAAWLAAALARRDLCRQPDLLRLLERELPALDEERCSQLFGRIADHLREGGRDDGALRALALRAFRRCGAAAQEAAVAERFEHFLHDDLQAEGFDDALTEAFNRLTAAPDAEPAAAWPVFVQNPRRTLAKMFRTAAEGPEQTRIMLRMMERLKRYRTHFCREDTEPCVVRTLRAVAGELATDAEQRNFAAFADGLRRLGVVGALKLLEQVVRPHLRPALRARDAPRLRAPLRLLLALPPSPLRAPLLAELAPALTLARWEPRRFDADMPATLELALDVVARLLGAGEDELPVRDLKWLRKQVQREPPLTRCYFEGARAVAGALAQAVRGNPLTLLTLAAREWSVLLPRDAPDRSGPGRGEPGRAGPGRGPGNGAPGRAGPGNGAPGWAGPGNGAPGWAGPGNGAPGWAGPGNGAPGWAGPGNGAPGWAGPRRAAPGPAEPRRVRLAVAAPEWDELVAPDAPPALDRLHAALMETARAERPRRTPATWACLLHAFRSFALTIKNNYLTEPLTDEQVMTVVGKIALLAIRVADELAEDYAAAVLPLLAHLAARRPDLRAAAAARLRRGATRPTPALCAALARAFAPAGPPASVRSG